MTTVNITQPAQYLPKEKSAAVAYLLLFLLGIFGVHQFYLGKTGRGVGYLLTAAWLSIGCWIDLFTLPAQVRQVNTQRRLGIR
jgi:TM2 domain-containing membrane protein YozV